MVLDWKENYHQLLVMKRVHGDMVVHQSSRPKTKKNCRRATCSMSPLLLSCFLCLSLWPQASQVMFACCLVSNDCNKVTDLVYKMCCHLTAMPSSLYLRDWPDGQSLWPPVCLADCLTASTPSGIRPSRT
jgi:hypothetical protein